MIIIPDNIIESCRNSKHYKRRLKLLEETLRKLGNFESIKNIIPTCPNSFEFPKSVLTVKDLDNTTFNFYSYSTCLYLENYHLTMKKDNSLFTYTYYFDKWKFSSETEILKLISISYQLSTNQLLKLELANNLCLTIEGDNKDYILVYQGKTAVLKGIEEKIEKIKAIEKLTLEEIISIISEQENLISCKVVQDKKEIANVYFVNGSIKSYMIDSGNKTTEVTIKPKEISKKISRSIDDKIIETRTSFPIHEDIEKETEEYKVLMCKL